MLDSTASSLGRLPLEILHSIFHYFDIPDIVRIRRVSRYLSEASYCRNVWSDAYLRAKFVLPPGPFLWQSARDLENALVTGFRVDRNLCYGGGTSQRERPTLKLREIRYTGVDLCVSLVFGRFLFIAFDEEVRCYDLNLDVTDSNSGASIIYRSSGCILRSFYCVSAIDSQGHPFACVVLSEVMQTTTQISIYSVNVGEESEVTLDLLHQFEDSMFDIDVVDLGPRVIVIHGRAPNLGGNWHWRVVALDVPTRMQLMLSSFVHAPWEETTELPEWGMVEEFTLPTSISTSTHLLLAQSFYTQANGWATFIQAFTLPHPHTRRCLSHTSTPLSPSHRGSVPSINMSDTLLLHDTVLDPTTQDILIAIRVYAYEPSRPRSSISKYGIIHLSTVFKSNDHNSAVGTIAFRLLGFFGRIEHPWTQFLHSSFNGTGRGFYMLEPGSWILSALEYDLHATDSDDGCGSRVIEYSSILRFPSPRILLDYDPYSGRMCLRSDMAKYHVIEILDLAV